MAQDNNIQSKRHRDRSVDRVYNFDEVRLDVMTDIETTSEAALLKTLDYEVLKRSIAEIEQMEPIYVYKRGDRDKYSVVDGATRVAMLQQLVRARPDETRFRYIVARVLAAENFDDRRRE